MDVITFTVRANKDHQLIIDLPEDFAEGTLVDIEIRPHVEVDEKNLRFTEHLKSISLPDEDNGPL